MLKPLTPDEPVDAQLDRVSRQARRLLAAGKGAKAEEIWAWMRRHIPVGYRDGRWMDEARGEARNFAPLMRAKPKTRLYILGCGRSGTWLLLGMMSTYRGVLIAPEERHFGHFAAIADAPEPVHIVKRSFYGHSLMARLPREIGLLYILRDPRDVLTSTHYEREFYITLERWTEEMRSLKALLDTGREHFLVTRFEDLVLNPAGEQARIAEAFGLEVEWPAARFDERFEIRETISDSMHGLRPPDPSVIGRWRDDPVKRAYLAERRGAILAEFQPLADRFGYDLSDF